ncbi:MAG: hypothetical protein ACM359_02950 [Bacillota bacterium]
MARRRYTRSVSAQPVRTRPAYWETETPTGGPQGIQIGNYVVKHYPSAGKVQTYNYFNGPRYQGLSKGVTINLDLMTAEELEALRSLLNTAIDAEKQRRIAAAPAQPAVSEPDPAQPTQPASDPARFKSLLQAVLAKTRTAAAAV